MTPTQKLEQYLSTNSKESAYALAVEFAGELERANETIHELCNRRGELLGEVLQLRTRHEVKGIE